MNLWSYAGYKKCFLVVLATGLAQDFVTERLHADGRDWLYRQYKDDFL